MADGRAETRIRSFAHKVVGFVSEKLYFGAMSTIVEEITDLDRITEVALGLPLSERAKLLEAIESSLLSEAERTEQDAWFKEIERRVAEVELGEVETIDGDQVMAEARAMLRDMRVTR